MILPPFGYFLFFFFFFSKSNWDEIDIFQTSFIKPKKKKEKKKTRMICKGTHLDARLNQ